MFDSPEPPVEKPPAWAGSRLADERELLSFLRVIRPDWQQPPSKGAQSNIKRVMKKLETIGVTTKEDLIERTMKNHINEDLNEKGFTKFGRETVDNIRKQAGFLQLMKNLTDTSVRQHGRFAPVPHLLSKKTRYGKGPGAVSGVRREPSPVDEAGLQEEDLLLDSARSPRDASNFGQADKDWGGSGGLGDSRSFESFSLGGGSRRLRNGWHTYTPDAHRTTWRDEDHSHRTSWRDSKMSLSGSLPNLSRSQTDYTPRAMRESAHAGKTWQPSRADELMQHIQTLQSASRHGSRAFTRAASQGEEELEDFVQSESFRDQGGSSTQMVKIAAAYAKGGVGPKHVLALLLDEKLTVGELRRELDQISAGKMQQVGKQMLDKKKALPRWKTEACDHSRTLLLEEAALDEKLRMDKMMRREGTVSPFDKKNTPLRRHIARQLSVRMKEEKERASSTSLEVSQKFINIKRHLQQMANSKRELGSMQKKMLEMNVEERVKEPTNSFSSMGMAAAASSAGAPGSIDGEPPDSFARQVSWHDQAAQGGPPE